VACVHPSPSPSRAPCRTGGETRAGRDSERGKESGREGGSERERKRIPPGTVLQVPCTTASPIAYLLTVSLSYFPAERESWRCCPTSERESPLLPSSGRHPVKAKPLFVVQSALLDTECTNDTAWKRTAISEPNTRTTQQGERVVTLNGLWNWRPLRLRTETIQCPMLS